MISKTKKIKSSTEKDSITLSYIGNYIKIKVFDNGTEMTSTIDLTREEIKQIYEMIK